MRNSKIIGMMMIVLLLALGCGRRSHDPRLERIRETVCSNPRAALQSLDSIDPEALPEKDRALLHLLTIKARDKAYIRHTSDSLVMAVISYYTRHRDKDLYPEALYYGGRVYSDLGDYPTALRYFQDALDLLPEQTQNLTLRGNVLSQTGGLLNDLGLHKQALPYLESVLRINHQMNDTLNLAFDYKMLGAIHLHLRDYDTALKNFQRAEKLATIASPEDATEDRMYQAAVHYYRGRPDKALEMIRPLPDVADSLALNLVLAYASKIYLKANIVDTAYMYARKLIKCSMPDNKKTGYMVMLSPALREFIPQDSLPALYRDYKLVLENDFIQQETKEALIQNSMYNYSVHDKMRRDAEYSRMKILILLIVSLAVILLLVAVIFYFRYRSRNRVIELHEALAKLKVLETALLDSKDPEPGLPEGPNSKDGMLPAMTDRAQKMKDETSLKAELRQKLRSINEQAPITHDLPLKITDSEPYLFLHSLLNKDRPIPDDSGIWQELEGIVSECFPTFKPTLLVLSDGNLNVEDLHISLLLKCGFTLKQLAVLLGRTKGAITYRRRKLSLRLLGEELDLDLVDKIIGSL